MKPADAASKPSVLEAKNLAVHFQGQVVLRNFSLSLTRGEKALLTGPSGCGKSTVLRCFLGFVIPEAGSLYVNGTQLTADSVWRLRRHVAYVAQEPDLGIGTALQVIERPFHFRANAALRHNLDRVPELFEQFHLSRDLLAKDVGALSGGEKQRIALISAILLDRTIFLLDEVTSALDRVSRQAVSDYFHSRDDATALIVAHNPEVFAFARRIVELPARPRERSHE